MDVSCVYFHFSDQIRNPSSSLCLDLLGKDEKKSLSVGMFYCQLSGDVGVSSNQVSSMFYYQQPVHEYLVYTCMVTFFN